MGNNFVVETVNVHIRVFDKTTGSLLLHEPLAQFFGASSAATPTWCTTTTPTAGTFRPLTALIKGCFWRCRSAATRSKDFQTYHLTNVGGFPDYQKLGFNKDAIFISYNDFGSGGAAATIASIDKAAALSGTLTYFVSKPAFQFRAMPPAQMHKDRKGGVEWFVSTDGTEAGGNTIRVTRMTNYLSNTPNFTYTSLPVKEYRSAQSADQPGGTITTFPNTTTTQVHCDNGRLVTAMASSTAADGFVYAKGLYYQVNVNGNTPRLIKEGVIDPGPGVAVQMPSVVEDQQGNLGLTWMESSNAEYLSMWVGNVYTNGNFSAQQAASWPRFFLLQFSDR